MGCLKASLIIFNVIFVCIGLAAIGFGAWAMIDDNFINNLGKATDDSADGATISILEASAIVIIVGGCIIFLIALLGCCGAWKESKIALGIYIVFLVVILAIQIAACVIAALFMGKAENELKKNLVKRLEENYDGRIPQDNQWNKGIDSAQQSFKCCGINNYTDFYGAKKWQHANNAGFIPVMCCVLKENKYPDGVTVKDPTCSNVPTDANSYWEKGCYESIKDELISRSIPVIIISAIIIFVEILCLVVAIALCCTIRREKVV